MDASIEKALNSLGDAVKESLGREGQIISAVDAFRVLLRQQLERIDHMNTDKVDFSTKEVVTIGLIDGDGIGAVISGLPLLSMQAVTQMAIVGGAFRMLAPGAAYTQFTYSSRTPVAAGVAAELGLTAAKGEKVWANLPPARVWHYRRD